MKRELAFSILLWLLAFVAARPAGAATARFALEPSEVRGLTAGATFDVNVTITDVSELYGWLVNMSFNPQVLNVENVVKGSFLEQTSETVFTKNIENSAGLVGAAEFFNVPFPEHGASGSGLLCTITFVVKSGGSSPIQFIGGTKLNTVVGLSIVPIADFTTADGSFGTPGSGGLGGFPWEYIAIIVVVVVAVVGAAFFLLKRRSRSQSRKAIR